MKAKIRKIISLLIVVLILLSCASCTGATKKVYKIGVLLKDTECDFSLLYASMLSDMFTQMEDSHTEYSVTILSSENSHDRQLSQTEVFANQQYDVLVVECVDSTKALEIVSKAVALYEIDEDAEQNPEEEGNGDNANGEDTNDNADDVNEQSDTQENVDDTLNDGLNAESNPRVDEVYVPNTKEVIIPIIFLGDEPVLEVESEAKEDTNTEDGDNADNPEEDDKIDTSLCCNILLDDASLMENITEIIKDMPLSGDKNANGTVEYAFVCSDSINGEHKALIEAIIKYFSENNIASNETFRYFAQTKDETFYKKVRENIEKNNGKIDIIFCLTDKALDSVYQLEFEQPSDTPDNGETEKEPAKLYKIGKDYTVVAIGLEDTSENLMHNSVIDKYITYDVEGMVQNTVDSVINFIKHREKDDFEIEAYSYEYVINKKEDSSSK